MPELHTLRLNGNAFDSVGDREIYPGFPGPVCSSLRRLEMRRCFLPAVPPRLSLLCALTSLDLSSNRQLEFQRSDAGIFSRLTSLRELVSFGAAQAGEGDRCLCHAVLFCSCKHTKLSMRSKRVDAPHRLCLLVCVACSLTVCPPPLLLPAYLQNLAKPPSPIHQRMEWSQASVAALLAVQRACSWLDLSQAMEEEEEG